MEFFIENDLLFLSFSSFFKNIKKRVEFEKGGFCKIVLWGYYFIDKGLENLGYVNMFIVVYIKFLYLGYILESYSGIVDGSFSCKFLFVFLEILGWKRNIIGFIILVIVYR